MCTLCLSSAKTCLEGGYRLEVMIDEAKRQKRNRCEWSNRGRIMQSI